MPRTFINHHLSRASSTLLAVVAWAASVPAADWPQWQGPNRDAISTETGLLQEWPEGGPPLAWKVTGLGGGYGAPSIAAGQIFGISSRGSDEVVWARSEADGRELWATRLGPALTEGMPQGKEGAGCTPTIDGDRLYVIGLGGDLACLQTADGKVLWQRNLIKDFGGALPTWRYNESPLIDGEKLVCTPGGTDATLVALNKSTGELIWKCQVPAGSGSPPAGSGGPPGGPPGRRGRPGGRGGFGGGSGAAYASAIAIDFDGQRQYVQLTAKSLVGVAANDGKLLWRYDKPANGAGINCSTPIDLEGRVFAASAYGAGGGLVKLSKDGSGVKADELWFSKDMENHHGGVIVRDGALYGANGGNGGGYLVCLDLETGKLLWRDRKAPKGSILFADGRLYYRTEDSGELLLIEPNKERYVELSRFAPPDRSQSPAWTHPVIANGKLYIRDQDVLLCYDVAAK